MLTYWQPIWRIGASLSRTIIDVTNTSLRLPPLQDLRGQVTLEVPICRLMRKSLTGGVMRPNAIRVRGRSAIPSGS